MPPKTPKACPKSSKFPQDGAAAAAEEKRKLWLQNLIVLGFPLRAFEDRYKITINSSMFDKPNKTGFEVVCHYLFSVLDKEKAKELFRTCYPVLCKKQWQEFRTVCSNWWKRIAEENPLFNIPRLSNTFLMSPGGLECYRLLFAFSNVVMYSEARKLNGKDEMTLLPPAAAKSKVIFPAQVVALKSALYCQSLELNRNMQLSKKLDEDAMRLAEEMLQRHREQLRRKKELEALKKELTAKLKINIKRTPSSILATQTPEKTLRTRTNRALNDARVKWNKMQTAMEEISKEREVVNSILMKEEGDRGLDAAQLAPKVPAVLLRQCADKVHENVGTSLYQEGELNLTSLMRLFNLCLQLVLEKLHEVGVPNFEGQIPFIVLQNNIHAKNIKTLRSMRRDLEQMAPEMKRKITHLKDRFDRYYQEKTEAENTLISGLPKPEFQSNEDSTANDENDNAIGLLPITPPFQFSDNTELTTPKLPEIVLPKGGLFGIESPALLETPTCAPESISQATVSLTPVLDGHSFDSADGRPVLRSDRSATPSVKQGTLEFTPGSSPKSSLRKGDLGKESLHRKMMKRTLVVNQIDSPVMTLEDDTLGTFSGFCSPMLTPSDDTVIEKVKSRTPEAVRKLVDQVVKYTMEEMTIVPGHKPSEDGPANAVSPAFFDLSSQLDSTVFQSRDKIARTPPTSSLLKTPAVISESEMKENLNSNDSINSSESSTICRSSASSSSRTRESSTSEKLEDLTLDNTDLSSPTPFQNKHSYSPLPNAHATPLSLTPIPANPITPLLPTRAPSNPFCSPTQTPSTQQPFTPFRDIDFSDCPDLFNVAPPDLLESFRSPETPKPPTVPVGNLIDL